MIYIKYIQLNSKSNEEQKQEFERLVLLYGAELDNHQNRTTPEEILSKWANSMITVQGDTDRHLELCYDGDILICFIYSKIDRPEHKGYIKVGYGYIPVPLRQYSHIMHPCIPTNSCLLLNLPEPRHQEGQQKVRYRKNIF